MPLARLAGCLLGSGSPLGACSSTDDGGPALLGLRFALLAVVFWAAVASGDARGRRGIAIAGAALVASLALRGLLVPFVVVALVMAGRTRRTLAAGAATVAFTLVAVLFATPQALAPDPLAAGDPAVETARWARRDNAFLAHAWAVRWAAREADPGAGHLALARTDWALGHADEARTEAALVAGGARDDAVRGQARSALDAWNAAP